MLVYCDIYEFFLNIVMKTSSGQMYLAILNLSSEKVLTLTSYIGYQPAHRTDWGSRADIADIT